MDKLEQVSRETMVFMRGNYRLDEIGDGKNELKFRQGQKTVLTVYLHPDHYTFLVIFGKKEREVFEKQRNRFSACLLDYYNQARTCHDGKWMFIDVSSPEQLEEVKQLILIKKKPNRKPFPRDGAVYAQCGQRCDLCVHYVHTSEAQRAVMEANLRKMWNISDWRMRCGGCDSDGCYCKDDLCHAKACARERGLPRCSACDEFPCPQATSADHRSRIHTEIHYADEITWGILPYVPYQYGKARP